MITKLCLKQRSLNVKNREGDVKIRCMCYRDVKLDKVHKRNCAKVHKSLISC